MEAFKACKYFFSIVFCVLFALLIGACHRGTGCPGEDAQVKTDKKGMPTSKSKSGLFDKKTMKKMNRG